MKIKLFTLIILLFIIFACYKPKVSNNNKKIKKIKKTEEKKELDKINDEINSNEFVYLFFDKKNFTPKTAVIKTVIKEVPQLNPNDYKVIVDWLVDDGTRHIKLKNLITGEIYLVKKGDTTGEIILLERNLFDYTFKIKNQLVKVKR